MTLSRRNFLGLGAAAIASPVSFASLNNKPTENPSRKLGIAIVGIGNFAGFALPRIQQSARARIAGFVSGDINKAKTFAEKWGLPNSSAYHYDDMERLKDDASIDLLYLTLPVGLHAEFAERGLLAGKHILSEKTLCHSSVAGLRLIELAKQMNKHYLIAYRTYFGPAYQALHQLVNDSNSGKLFLIDAHKGFSISLPASNWRFNRKLAGGGSLVDVGVYSVQAARLFAGQMPSTVSACISSDRNDARFKECEDNLVFTMKFNNGITATGSSSWSYSLQNRIRLGFEQCWAQLEPASSVIGQELLVGKEKPRVVERRSLMQQDQMPLMFDHCADVILAGQKSIIDASEGVKDLRIIEAMYRSAESGKLETVDLSGLNG